MAQAFVDLYDDAGCNGIADEMSWWLIEVGNQHWPLYHLCTTWLRATEPKPVPEPDYMEDGYG